MPTAENIRWFKEQFGRQISADLKGTPFTLDMLTAIACQETGYIWARLRKKGLTIERLLELSVGDTISKRTSTFPKDKADLLAAPRGPEMFKVARDSLVDLARYLPDFAGPAANPDKFCHGFGIFQYDIQFFKTEPDYFLQRRWRNFDEMLGKAITVLKGKMARAGVAGKTRLTDMEMAQVAIAYNRGKYDPALGLKQGHKDAQGVYYGEHFWSFLQLSKSVQVNLGAAPASPPPAASPPRPPAPAPAGRPLLYLVNTKGGTLRLRSTPKGGGEDNVLGQIPDGHQVVVLSTVPVSGFLQIEALLGGRLQRGYAGADYLRPIAWVGD